MVQAFAQLKGEISGVDRVLNERYNRYIYIYYHIYIYIYVLYQIYIRYAIQAENWETCRGYPDVAKGSVGHFSKYQALSDPISIRE